MNLSASALIDKLILIAGAWKATGLKDESLEYDFARNLRLLRIITGTDFEGALQLLTGEIEVSRH